MTRKIIFAILVLVSLNAHTGVDSESIDDYWTKIKPPNDFSATWADVKGFFTLSNSITVNCTDKTFGDCLRESWDYYNSVANIFICDNCGMPQLGKNTLNAERWNLRDVQFLNNVLYNYEDGFLEGCQKQYGISSLELGNVSFPFFKKSWFSAMTSLEKLSIHNNPDFEIVPAYAFDNMWFLKVLYLTSNGIRKVHKWAFKKTRISTLFLGQNFITHIHDETFQGIPELVYVDLSNNPILSIKLEVLGNIHLHIHGWPCRTVFDKRNTPYLSKIRTPFGGGTYVPKWYKQELEGFPCINVYRSIPRGTDFIRGQLNSDYFLGQTRQYFNRLTTLKALFGIMDLKKCHPFQRFAAKPVLKDLEDSGYKIQRAWQANLQAKTSHVEL